MRRTKQLQGLRLMKCEDVYGRCLRSDLSQGEAAEILNVSERTFRRWRDRWEAEGLYDRRPWVGLGTASCRFTSSRATIFWWPIRARRTSMAPSLRARS